MLVLTGSQGFIGKHIMLALLESGRELRALVRKSSQNPLVDEFVCNIDSSSDYSSALNDCNVIIHCAARAHIMKDKLHSPLEAYRSVNLHGTLNLARQAASNGVRRFIYISSIKVNGESSTIDTPFSNDSIPSPVDDYGLSKFEAEQELSVLASKTGMELVIIRPTLVYGPGVKANFASLLNLVSSGVPLPFACINNNKRSLVSIANLVDLIVRCIEHPKATNQVFLVSDDQDVSTSEMVSEMATALDKPTWQLPVPVWCYQLVGKLFGKADVVDRLVGSLQVDITHTKETLGWKPPQSLQDGFKETAKAFLHSKQK